MRGFFVLIMIVMFVFVLLVLAGGAVLLFFVGRKLGAGRLKALERHVDDWAADEGYDLLDISDRDLEGNPFSRRRPYRPGVVRTIRVKDRRGRVRRGWVFFPARLGPGGYSGFRLEAMQVEWQS